MQKLTLPFKKSMVICGYKVASYAKEHGYPHYGIDIESTKYGNGEILASGTGKVLAAGKDNSLGYGVSILYENCFNRLKDEGIDIVARYMHMSELNVKTGDTVIAGDVLGIEGKEGTASYHLHLEFDTDCRKMYACYSPQVSKGHDFWIKGIDTTLDPSAFLYVGEGQEQVESVYNKEWLNDTDENYPMKEVKEMIKYPIDTRVPFDTEDEEWEAYGKPTWAYLDRGKWLEVFDKFWRKIPTKSSNYGREFASEEVREAAHPITAEELAQVTEPQNDFREFEEYFAEYIAMEQEQEKEDNPTVETPAITPSDTPELAKAFNGLIESLHHFAKAFGVTL